MQTETIETYMTSTPHTIGSEQTLAKAKEEMQKLRCRHLPVKHGGNLVGILSKSDLGLVEKYERLDDVRVEDVMTTDMVQVSPNTPLLAVARQMAEQHLSSVLVTTKNKELLGIFTWVDLAKAFADHLSQH